MKHIMFFVVAVVFILLAALAAHAQGEPTAVPEYLPAPTPPREFFAAPAIKAVQDADGELITISNYALSAQMRIGSPARPASTNCA